ncbi:MAG: hypothetical protein QG620_245 [Patescibacteria group bacterium]|nr:hypothetical protein [Patescibacteria group bacterium]
MYYIHILDLTAPGGVPVLLMGHLCYNETVNQNTKTEWRWNMMDNKKIADGLIAVSVATALISGYVSVFGSDVFNLAGTQWMMIAIVLGIYGLYAKLKMA